MELHLYNPINQKVIPLKLKKAGQVDLYVCGPTVYNDLHIGNMRIMIVFDAFAKALTWLNYKVNYVANITDIDDKIINKAQTAKVSEQEIATRYANNFLTLLKDYHIFYPRRFLYATTFLSPMQEVINSLIKADDAYCIDGNVYFRVEKYLNIYGDISKQKTTALKTNNHNEKENNLDFALWKNTTEGIKYPSHFGPGRPGWHTECATMIYSYFKDTVDIHGGGLDLKFPHHENENVQFYALTGKKVANTFMHVGLLYLNNTKMAKSLGNIILAKDIIKNYNPNSFKLLILAHSYRQPINFSWALLDQYQREYGKIKRCLKSKIIALRYNKINTKQKKQSYLLKIKEYLCNDFDTANIISLIFELVKLINKSTNDIAGATLVNTLAEALALLGLWEEPTITEEIVSLYGQWLGFKNQQDYAQADIIRNKLEKLGAFDE